MEDPVLVHCACEGGVEGVDAFHEEHVVLFQLHAARGVELAAAFLEVELGNEYLLAGEQVVEVLVQELHVHGPQALEVVVAVLVARGVLTVAEVVVQFYDLGGQPEHVALLGDAQGAAGLSAGTRTGDHHYPRLVPAPVDLVRGLGVFALLTRLAEVYQRDGVAVRDYVVNLLYRVNSDGGAPVLVLLPCCFDLCHISFSSGISSLSLNGSRNGLLTRSVPIVLSPPCPGSILMSPSMTISFSMMERISSS